MKLSTKSRYGVRAMTDIALYGETGASQLKDISKRQAISAKYLDHILSALRKGRPHSKHAQPYGRIHINQACSSDIPQRNYTDT